MDELKENHFKLGHLNVMGFMPGHLDDICQQPGRRSVSLAKTFTASIINLQTKIEFLAGRNMVWNPGPRYFSNLITMKTVHGKIPKFFLFLKCESPHLPFWGAKTPWGKNATPFWRKQFLIPTGVT